MKIRNISQKIDKAVVLLFFVALIGYMPTARPSDRNVWIIALLILMIRTLWHVVNKRVVIKFDKSLIWYLCIFLYGGLSCVWSKSTASFELYLLMYFPVVICAVLCLGVYIGQRIDPDQFLYLLIIAGVIAGIRYCAYTDWSSLTLGYYIRGTFGGLLDSVTNYNNYTTPLCVVCIISVFYAIIREKKLCYISSIILIAILVLGGSRKNLVVVPVMAIWFSLSKGNALKKLKLLLLSLVIIAAGVYAMMKVPFLSQIRDRMLDMIGGLFGAGEYTADGSTVERQYLMNTALSVWGDHIFLGVGWGNFQYYNHLGRTAHNNYCELLASLGVVGFFMYYLRYASILITAIKNSLKRILMDSDKLLVGIILSFLIAEFGSIILYGREKMIMLLILMYFSSYVKESKLTVIKI